MARRTPRGARLSPLVLLAPLCAVLLTGCFSAPPQIIRLSPVNGSTGVAADAPILVVFDHPVQRDSVVARFHVDPGIGGCDLAAAFHARASARCHVAWDAESSSFTLFHPAAPLVPNTRYTLTVSPGVTDQQGVANSLDHSWNITTGPPPTVNSVSPSDGSALVPVDSPMVVAFSNAMDASTTNAITLRPAVPGTRVFRNTRDHGRFVVIPGRLLDSGVEYTLTVGTGAVDEHGERLATEVTSVFRTGQLDPNGHAVVLARRSGEPATQVLLTQLGAPVPGEPAAAAAVLDAPRCPDASAPCGAVASGAPVVAYEQATVSSDGHWLAVVERDLRSPGGAAAVSLVALPSLVERHLVENGSQVSWSPDGTRLAYQAPDGFHVQTIASGHDVRLPAGDPLAAPAEWSGDGSALALPVQHPGSGARAVDLAVPALDVRYAVPGLDGDASSPALSPDGSLLAVRRDGSDALAGAWTVRLRGGDATPRRLGSDLTPVAFVDNGTLLAAERPPDGDSGLVRVSIADGGRDRLGNQPLASDLSTAVVAPSGRQVGYLLPDDAGVRQAAIENVDGSNPAFLTTFTAAGFEAIAVDFSS